MHVICDNASTHKAPEIQRWLNRHRRFTMHHTPTYSSWLNQVERWFSELTTKKHRRSTHRSVAELRRDINDWVDHWNENPRPFVWRKTADEILDNLASYLERINDSGHLPYWAYVQPVDHRPGSSLACTTVNTATASRRIAATRPYKPPAPPVR